jgi:hypothetical protein
MFFKNEQVQVRFLIIFPEWTIFSFWAWLSTQSMKKGQFYDISHDYNDLLMFFSFSSAFFLWILVFVSTDYMFYFLLMPLLLLLLLPLCIICNDFVWDRPSMFRSFFVCLFELFLFLCLCLNCWRNFNCLIQCCSNCTLRHTSMTSKTSSLS